MISWPVHLQALHDPNADQYIKKIGLIYDPYDPKARDNRPVCTPLSTIYRLDDIIGPKSG